MVQKDFKLLQLLVAEPDEKHFSCTDNKNSSRLLPSSRPEPQTENSCLLVRGGVSAWSPAGQKTEHHRDMTPEPDQEIPV